MLRELAALALAALLGCAPLTATAIPVTYQIKFTVLTGSVVTVTTPAQPGPSPVQVEDAAGNVYFGLFAVDDEILLTDGVGKAGDLDFFYIQMEDNIWGYNTPANNSFAEFRGPCTFCGSAPSPGFDVVNGAITNLRGGVSGPADVPFVDFSWGGPNTFDALGMPFSEPGTAFSFVRANGPDGGSIHGTMEIYRVPEPSTLVLFGLGLFVMVLFVKRARGVICASGRSR